MTSDQMWWTAGAFLNLFMIPWIWTAGDRGWAVFCLGAAIFSFWQLAQ